MAKKKKSPKTSGAGTIARNKRATFDYKIEQKFEAGLVLQGWEIKSLREGRVQLTESYVQIYKMEAWLFGCQISPLVNASTHVVAEAQRRRKLLLHRRELAQLIGLVERKGYTIVPLALYWKRGRIKLEIGVGKGKKEYDKRASIKERDWQRDKARHIRVN
ncbi:MAG: SsrA-binding protein SmpB [Gammaproteobacteria bacterium]|nr:SsrA-binding protein SmpB [Gammaproteobacteria bacterium]